MMAMMLQALAFMADARPTFPTALAIADGGSAVAEALRAHGVVRVTRALSKSAAAALMEAVDLSLADALQATEGNEIDSEQWQSRFGDIMSPRNRHDVKLSLEAPPVRAALASLLGTLEPALSASLGEDALLHELAALISLPGARRQPIHPDTPIKKGSGTDQGPVILTGFCALQDVDASMGPTLFLPSTHTAEAHAAFFTYENFDLYISSTSDEDEDERDAEHETRVSAQLESLQPWRSELCTGDVSLFDSRCLHAGDANTSQRRRYLFYFSFIKAAHAEATTTYATMLESLRGKLKLGEWRQWLRVPSASGAATPGRAPTSEVASAEGAPL